MDFGGVTFAPQVSVSGDGSGDVVAQLRDAFDEFRDMLDEYMEDRVSDYAPVF